MSSNPYQSRLIGNRAPLNASVDEAAGLAHTVPPSADVSGAVGTRQRSPPSMRGLTSPVTHFEEDVPVNVRQLDREEVCQPLGVAVTSGHIGTARCVSVRLTDPRDPFFLYSMTLSEDDYGRFKEAHELHVDWNGFPQDLIALLSGAFPDREQHDAANRSTGSVLGPRNVTLRFVTAGASGEQGTLRIMEPTAFREIEVLKLSLAKQGDVGQKQYLAERFKFFEAEYHHCFRERADEAAKAAKATAAFREQIATVEHERDTLRSQLEREAGAAELEHSSVLHGLKDKHQAELSALRAEADREHAASDERLRLAKQAHEETRADLQQRLDQALTRASASEGENRELRRSLDDASSSLADANAAVARLEAKVAELSNFKIDATSDRAQRELREATMQERLKHFEAAAKERAEELGRMREQYEAQKQYAATFKEQLDSANTKNAVHERNLSEARQSIVSQQSDISALKANLDAATKDVKAAEALCNERTLAAERAKQESSLATERLQMAERQMGDVKSQLDSAEQGKAKLVEQLKQNEDALVHMQRLSSNAGPRLWQAPRSAHADVAIAGSASAIAAKYASSANSMSVRPGSAASHAAHHHGAAADAPPTATAGLFRDFARGATSGASSASPRAPTPEAAAPTASTYRPASHSAGSKGHAFAAAGTANTSMASSIPTFDSAAASRAEPAKQSKVPTSAYFPSLE